jgi:hypothetical protein
VLAALTRPLTEAVISASAISTYDTDYLLVKDEQLTAAAALTRAGHVLATAEHKRRWVEKESVNPKPDLALPLPDEDPTSGGHVASAHVRAPLR